MKTKTKTKVKHLPKTKRKKTVRVSKNKKKISWESQTSYQTISPSIRSYVYTRSMPLWRSITRHLETLVLSRLLNRTFSRWCLPRSAPTCLPDPAPHSPTTRSRSSNPISPFACARWPCTTSLTQLRFNCQTVSAPLRKSSSPWSKVIRCWFCATHVRFSTVRTVSSWPWRARNTALSKFITRQHRVI